MLCAFDSTCSRWDLLKKLRLRLVLWLSLLLWESRILGFLKKLRFAVLLVVLFVDSRDWALFSLSLWDSKIVELESWLCELCGVESLAVGFVISVPLWDSRIFELESGLCVFFG